MNNGIINKTIRDNGIARLPVGLDQTRNFNLESFKRKRNRIEIWSLSKNPLSKNYNYHIEIKKEATGTQTLFFILFHFSHNNSIKSEK